MATQRKWATGAQECAILEMLAERPRSVPDLAEAVRLTQKETRRILKMYRRIGTVHQLWALTPLPAGEHEEAPVEIAARRSVPFTLQLPFMIAEEVTV